MPVQAAYISFRSATADGKKFVVDIVNTRQSPEPLTLVPNWTADLKK